MLAELATQLRQTLGILHKRDIQMAAQLLHQQVGSDPNAVLLGDDCAAIPHNGEYLLLAAEGIAPFLVENDPWFAGWSSILVNVSDIYAMGGYPIAVVDTIWSLDAEVAEPIWQGMQAAAQAFNVPIVGGHSNSHSPYTALSVAILGKATHLISSFNAQPGDRLLLVTDVQGKPHPRYPFWDAATEADPMKLRQNLALLPAIAESGLCDAGKDISMGGLVGTLLMLLETSGRGAVLDLDRVPCPPALTLERWLVSFPSYGFLLSIEATQVAQVQAMFHAQGLVCEPIGAVQPTHQLVLRSQHESIVFWDLAQDPLTGFGRAHDE